MAGVATEKTFDAQAFYEQGKEKRAAGDIGGAITAFNQALKLKPDFEAACLDLARLLDAAKQTAAAVKIYEHWLKILQSQASKTYIFRSAEHANTTQTAIAQATAQFDRGDIEQALAGYSGVLTHTPDMPTALLGVAVCLHARQRFAEAIEKLLLAIRISAGYAAALNTLGTCYQRMGQFVPAIAAYRQAIAADPTLEHVWANLVRSYTAIGDAKQAMAAYEQSLPHTASDTEPLIELIYFLSRRCQWESFPRYSEALTKIIQAGGCCEPFKALAYVSPALQLGNAQRWTRKYWPNRIAYDAARPLPSAKRGDGKLRIGYLSSDFHTHATLALITELFELHDRTRFEIYAYSCGPDDKSTDRARVQTAVDIFRDIRTLGDGEAAQTIASDGVDVLVELKGYTQDQRLGIAAQRPAPLQMHYLGYPGTLGADFIDYFITDGVVSPIGAEKDFSESLIRLPHSYQINDRRRALPTKTKSRADHGLPDNAFVFCDFNSAYKITPDIFSLWMRLLNGVEGSVLWLYCGQKEARENLRREAEKYGVDPVRLVFASHAPAMEHLERYRHADMCIDTFPVCSHTTASDALWCGVPLVTMAGESFVSRVAASLLHAAGLPELVTTNLADYEKLALELAQDRPRVEKLRSHLETARMQFPLFDSLSTTRAIEAAYAQAVEWHKNGKPPRAFTLTPALEAL